MSKNPSPIPGFISALFEGFRHGFIAMSRHPVKVAIVLIIIVAIVVVSNILDSRAKAPTEETPVLTEMPPPPVRPLVDNFVLPEEPVKKAEFKPFNEPKARWTAEDAQKHKREPDSKMLSDLHSANEAKITQMLKEVP
ncbi:MAG: hypothetical protein IIW10_05500 [Spirochaetaceae bacterium]|jgi:hypothetical protein|nr:hypothetical protein [Spirochaetaceae bacterium]